MTELLHRIERILAAETAYAEKLRERGEFGQAKYIWAAVSEIGRAVRSVEGDDAERLRAALDDAKRQYRYDWNDEDGIGTSSFSRVLDLLE